MKQCAGQCGEIKPLEAFFVTKWFADGHTPRCRQCVYGSAKHKSETSITEPKRRSARSAGEVQHHTALQRSTERNHQRKDTP